MNPIAVGGMAVGNARDTLFPMDAMVCGVRRLIGVVLGVNLNSANTDTVIPLLLRQGCNFVNPTVSINNASTNLTTATFGVFTAAAGGGTALVASGTVMTGLTTATSNLTATATAASTQTVWNQATQGGALYFRNVAAQGAAATADVYVFADVLP